MYTPAHQWFARFFFFKKEGYQEMLLDFRLSLLEMQDLGVGLDVSGRLLRLVT